MSNNFPSIPALTLKTDIISTDSAFKLRSIKWYTGSDGVDVDLSASDFGATGYGVFEPRTSRQEFFTWDTSTIADYGASGITIDARGLPWGSDYSTEAASRKFSHPAGSQVLLFTDAPAMWNTMACKENAETITGEWTYTSTARPKYNTHPTFSADEELIDKKYADDLAIAGAPDASTTVKGISEIATPAECAAGAETGTTGGILVVPSSNCATAGGGTAYANKIPVLDANGVLSQTFLDSARTWGAVQSLSADNCQITSDADSANDAVRQSYMKAEISKGYTTGTAGETLVAGNAVYLKAADGKLWKADTDADESTFSFVGVIVVGGAADATVYYARPGDVATGLSGLTAGTYYYLTGTAGTLGTTPGTRFAKVAQALSTTTARIIEPKFIASGSQVFSSSTTAVQTCGFYPARITLYGNLNAGSTSHTEQAENNVCMKLFFSTGSTTYYTWDATKAYSVASSGATSHVGTVSARSATGFTLSNTKSGSESDITIYWTAFSE